MHAQIIFFQDEVRLTAPSATPKPINLEECILCQKKKRSEYLSSGEIGRGCIVSLAKQRERRHSSLQLTVQEQGIMKYHTSTCYRSFQRDMAKTDSIPQTFQQSEPPQHGPIDDTPEQRSKRFKPNTNVCIFCGADRKTVNWKKIHTLYRICEKPMAQKLLNAAMLFKDHVYTETAALCEVEDVFAADIRYHAHCCKGYFNRYQAKIEEILKNLDMEDSVTAGDASFKARFLALGLDFNTSAHSLTSIRDRLNEDSAESVSNRAVKQLIIEIHIIFDNYREDSIKNRERERRGKSRELVVLDLISPNQNVPVVLENFWSSSISKSAFQAFYVEWLTTNYKMSNLYTLVYLHSHGSCQLGMLLYSLSSTVRTRKLMTG